MPIDPNIPLQVQVPDFDIAKPLMQSAQIIGQNTQNLLNQQKYDQMRKQIVAQDTFAKSGNVMDLAAHPESMATTQQALSSGASMQRENLTQKLDVASRAAEAYINNPTKETWDQGLVRMKDSGHWNEQELAPLWGKPNMESAQRMRAYGMKAEEHGKFTGEYQMNQPRDVGPDTSVVVPSRVAPRPSISRPETTPPGTVPAAAEPATAPTVITPTTLDDKTVKVPKTNYDAPSKQGEVWRGQDPVVRQAKVAAQESYEKTTKPGALAAKKSMTELKSFISALESGRVSPGITAEYRKTVASLIYEVTRNPQLAGSLTGVNPSDAEAMNKNSIRLGFNMAREMGAQQAASEVVMAIQANPNLMGTKEGQLKIAKFLDAQANWTAKKAEWGSKWFDRNHNMVGFDEWYSQKFPLEVEASKAIPWQVPKNEDGTVNTERLQPNVTYEGHMTLPNGDLQMFTGRWNPNKNGFIK